MAFNPKQFDFQGQVPTAAIIQAYQNKAAQEFQMKQAAEQEKRAKLNDTLGIIQQASGLVQQGVQLSQQRQQQQAQQALTSTMLGGQDPFASGQMMESGQAGIGQVPVMGTRAQYDPTYKSELAAALQTAAPDIMQKATAEELTKTMFTTPEPPKEKNIIGAAVGKELNLPADTTVDAAKLILDLRKENKASKADLKDAQKEARLKEMETNRAKVILGKVDQAMGRVGRSTSGFLGNKLNALGYEPAADLEGDIETIQANLGFEQLQRMREASPTGGALGQIAVKELDFLQAAVSSLKQRQSPAKLKANLKEIQTRYSNWLKIANPEEYKAYMKSKASPAPKNSPQVPDGWSIKIK